MKNLIFAASAALTFIIFASGYAVQFLITIAAMSLDLPGPYADSPVAWVWFVVSLLFLFGVSLVFCRVFARRVEKKLLARTTFE